MWLRLLGRQLTGKDAVGTGIAVPVVGGDDAIGPDMDGWYPAGAKRCREENAHRLLAGRDDAVRIAGAELPGAVNVRQRVVEGGMELVERSDRGDAFLVVGN